MRRIVFESDRSSQSLLGSSIFTLIQEEVAVRGPASRRLRVVIYQLLRCGQCVGNMAGVIQFVDRLQPDRLAGFAFLYFGEILVGPFRSIGQINHLGQFAIGGFAILLALIDFGGKRQRRFAGALVGEWNFEPPAARSQIAALKIDPREAEQGARMLLRVRQDVFVLFARFFWLALRKVLVRKSQSGPFDLVAGQTYGLLKLRQGGGRVAREQ